MNCKKILAAPLAGTLACGVALSALAFAPVANAQGAMTGDTMMATPSTPATMMTMPAPTQVSGTVLRYYSDRTGLVNAMDLQTATGIEFIRFSPGLAQRVMSVAPVGGTATVYVSGSPTTRWDLVGFGDRMPSPNVMVLPAPSDIEVLESTPFITSGAKQMTIKGTLQDTITNSKGEVVGLVLSGSSSNMMMDGMMANMAMPMNGMTLVRVGRGFRHDAPGYMGTERVTPLFKGSDVVVTGYTEAPRYGVISAFQNRIDASALVVNGRNVGAIGIQRSADRNKAAKMMMSGNMMSGGMMGGTMSAEQTRAMDMGYSTYSTTTTTTTTTTETMPMS